MTATLSQAAAAIAHSDAILVTTGAGMGVDSGLPDFRGNEGFWRAYPPFASAGLSFVDLANPALFDDDPELAWGFYGHRLELYRRTAPHRGFEILSRWAQKKANNGFVFTSNVDGHFQKAGWDDERIVECHGSLLFLQCSQPCHDDVWPADDLTIDVDPDEFRARGELPSCPHCGAVARPNVLMFSDGRWLWRRSEEQQERLREWLEGVAIGNLAIIECGAGGAIPTVRRMSERVVRLLNATLIRINPREAQGPEGTLSIEMGALEALERIDKEMAGM